MTLAAAPLSGAAAADLQVSRNATHSAVVHRPPLALRNLSRLSASVMASTPCWRDCTTACGFDFQACRRVDPLVGCLDVNNACDLFCLKQCRLKGGPLVSWTDY